MVDVFEEVEDQIRTERYMALAKRLAPWAIGAGVALVVSLGARGAIAVDRSETAAQPAFAANPVDTTGAGDSFNAAFLHARTQGGDLQRCLAFGCAAASRTISFLGARTGLPTVAQVETLLAGLPAVQKAHPC